MPPKFLIEKAPEGLLSIVDGDLPLDITPPNGPGVYKVHALSDSNTEVTVTSTTAPVLMSAPVVGGSGLIGSIMGATPGTWGDVVTVTGQWLADGVPIAGATGVSLTLSDAQDNTDLSYLETALNGAGSTSAQSNTLPVRFAAPVVTGTLYDEIFDQGQGYGDVPTAQVFEGAGLQYAAVGGNALINAAIGLVQIPTDTPQEGAVVSVTASNSGGSATAAFQVTVEEDPGETLEVTEILADGVEFRFDRAVEVGTFVNGDWFVIANGASLTEALPGSEEVSTSAYSTGTGAMSAATGATRWINGLELGMSFEDAQGFDSYIRDEGAGARTYFNARNWDPGATGQVLGLAAGQQIVKAVSVAQDPASYSGAVSDLKNPLSKLVTLTVLASAPPAGAFRPPLKGWDGVTFYTESMIDWSRLPSEDVSTLMPAGDPDDMASPFPFWLDGGLGDKVTQSTAVDQTQGTADALGRQVGLNLMWLCGQTPLSEKVPHGLDMIQAGLDGLLTRIERPGGYAGQGLVPAGAFAAHMLDQSELNALASAVPNGPGDLDSLGQEQHQVFGLPQAAVDTPVEPNLTDPAAHYGQDYQAAQLGLPEWEALDPANTPESSPSEPISTSQPPFADAALAVRYGPDPAYAGPTTGNFYAAPDGDDANDGLSVGAPFASIRAAIDAADAAGGAQTILLRGGTYRERVSLEGTTAHFRLEAYGTEKPRLVGSEPLTGWTQCTSADQNEVGANFSNIYKTTISTLAANLAHEDFSLLNLYEGETRCDIAQDRADQVAPHAWLNNHTFHNAADGGGQFNIDGNGDIASVTDPAVMGGYTAAQVLSSTFAVYCEDNRVKLSKVTAFDPNTSTASMETLYGEYTGGGEAYYSIINASGNITQGRWAALDNGNDTATVYFRPNDANNLETSIEYSVREVGIDFSNMTGDLTVRGLDLLRVAGFGTNVGCGIGSGSNRTAVKPGIVTIENCRIGQTSGDNYGSVFLENISGGVNVKNCHFFETGEAALSVFSCNNSWVDQCKFYLIGSNALRTYGVVDFIWSYCDCEDITRNAHNNFANFYIDGDRILMWGIRARNVFGYTTYSQSSNLAFCFNDLQCTTGSADERALVDNLSTVPPSSNSQIYVLNNATRPDPSGTDNNANSFSTGANDNGERYTLKNNGPLHGYTDGNDLITSTGGNFLTYMTNHSLSTAKPDNEEFLPVSEFYVDATTEDYRVRDNRFRGRVGESIATEIATLQAMHPTFPHFDKDFDGRVYDPANPPVGPQTVLETTPAEPTYTIAPVTFDTSTWFDLESQLGWNTANYFTVAMRFTWTDNSERVWVLRNSLNFYLAVNTDGSLRLRIRFEDGTVGFINTEIASGWVFGNTYSITLQVGSTGFELRSNGIVLAGGAYDAVGTGPIRVPQVINGGGESLADIYRFELDGFWFTFDDVSAAHAEAVLFESSASYAITSVMSDGSSVSGTAPQFYETRASGWATRAGWRGPVSDANVYRGAEISRADRVRALQGLVPSALAMHLVPQFWTVSGADPLRDYLDRVMSWFAQHYDAGTADFTNLTKWGVNLETAVSAAEYAFYRDVILPQISPWSGVPEVPLPPQVVYNGSGALVVTPADFAAGNNSPVTARNMRYRLHGASQWVEVAGIGAQALISGVGTGDSYEVQIQHVNTLGAGGWSYNAPLMGGPAAGPLRASGII